MPPLWCCSASRTSRPAIFPEVLRERLPEERVLTVLQNVDPLYWRAAGEPCERVEAVRVSAGVVCAFNSTPLEKYENYRLHLSRWGRTEEEGPDLVPTIYNLIDSLLRFLDIDRYSSHNGTQPKFLVDLMPEVYCRASGGRLRQLLSRHQATPEEIEAMVRHIEDRGSVYLPQVNAFYVREFKMMYAAEEAARFLHHACRGLPARGKNPEGPADANHFYGQTIEYALGYFGSRVLYPARPLAEDAESRELPEETSESERKRPRPAPNCWATCWGTPCTMLTSRDASLAVCCDGCFLPTWMRPAKRKKRIGKSPRESAAMAKSCPPQ